MRKLLIIVFCLLAIGAFAQEEENSDEQSRASAAMDATATQWSFQVAYQSMPDYYDDLIGDPQQPRQPGLDNYLQVRVMAPIPLKKVTILPRLTIRHYEDVSNGKSGLGNTELFALIIPKAMDWGTGRVGIGPMVTLPGNPDVAKDEWGYGFAATIVNNTGQWFYGLLFTQSWRAVDPNALSPDQSDTNPLGIAPFVNYRIGSTGFYLGTPDMVALYDWKSKGFYLPIGLRFGKVFIFEKSSLNVYAEYRTSAVYKSWEGSAVKNSYRLNVSYTIPINF
jgi:hypothetical protein